MGPPAVSVIMNCLNGARYLRDALDSVYAQTYQDWEIIFWNDGSSDESAMIATSYDAKLRYFLSPVGPDTLGDSRNCALAKAQGRYLAILDCDDTWEATKLERQLDVMRGHGLVSSDCWKIEADGQRFGRYHEALPVPVSHHYRALLRGSNFLPSPTLLFDAGAVRMMGGCNPRFRYAELYDLCVRIAHDYPIAVVAQPLASYRFHAGQRGGTGCAAMTKEVLEVMRRHRAGAPMGQYLREGVLWGRYGWQTVTHS